MTLKNELVTDDIVFKGGNLTVKSDGLGPDTYLFRRFPRKPWVRVEIRHSNRDEYQDDLESLSIILKHCQRVDTGTLRRTFQTLWEPPTMSASKFLEKYGGN